MPLAWLPETFVASSVVKLPAAAVVPPIAGGVVRALVRSLAAIAAELNTPGTEVACSTSLVVVSEFAPTIYSVVTGKVSVTAPLDAGKFSVVKLLLAPVTIWLVVFVRLIEPKLVSGPPVIPLGKLAGPAAVNIPLVSVGGEPAVAAKALSCKLPPLAQDAIVPMLPCVEPPTVRYTVQELAGAT